MKYIHLKSNELVNGSPKLPPVSVMQVGEIAINYKDGHETLFIKNDNNEIVSFSSDDIIMSQTGGGGAAINGLFSSVAYNSSAKKIYFYDKNNTKCGEVDTTDFIKDGMIDSVTVSNGNLVMSFNTDAGKQDITLALTQIFNPSNYYTKTEIDGKGYLTTETDPTVHAWAKAANKPSYSASEVGALPTGTTLDNVPDGSTRKLSNYALQSSFTSHTGNSTMHVTASEKSTWNGKQDAISDLNTIKNNASSGAAAYTAITAHTANTSIHLTTGNVKTQIESYGYITGYTETDPTVPDWAKAESKPSYTLDEVTDGTTRKLSNYATQDSFNAHTASTTVHVSSSEKSTWNGKQDALSNANVLNGITSTKVSNWDAAATNRHTHSNKTVLDGITTAKTTSWDSVTAKTNNADFTAHTSDATIHFTTGDVKTQIESYGYTTNVGTVTGVSINGSTKSPSNGLVTLGTVITAETQLTTASTGTGNVITDITVNNHKITKTKGITIPNWATATTKPSYTASEVGALPTGTNLDNVPDGSTRKLSNYALQSDFASHTASTLHMPAVTSSDNGKILQVVNGAWTLVTPVSIHYGSTAPDNSIGNDGDIYIQQ